MTHASDELLSALVDGEELPSGDAAHVDECAECQDRLDALRGVVAVVAAPVAMPAGHIREAAVAAALVETTGAVPAIRRVVTRRDRVGQSRSPRRMSTVSAAAALLVALGVGGWVLSQVGRAGNDSVGATTALRGNSETADAAGGAATELFSATAPAADPATVTASAYDAGAIGDFTDIDAVARKATGDLALPPEAQAQRAYAGPDPCGSDDAQTLEWHASLTYRGEAAYARVWRATGGSRLLQVQRQTDCVLLETRAL